MFVNMYFTIGANNSFPFVEFLVVCSSAKVTEYFFPTPSPATTVLSYCVIERAVASCNAHLGAFVK